MRLIAALEIAVTEPVLVDTVRQRRVTDPVLLLTRVLELVLAHRVDAVLRLVRGRCGACARVLPRAHGPRREPGRR